MIYKLWLKSLIKNLPLNRRLLSSCLLLSVCCFFSIYFRIIQRAHHIWVTNCYKKCITHANHIDFHMNWTIELEFFCIWLIFDLHTNFCAKWYNSTYPTVTSSKSFRKSEIGSKWLRFSEEKKLSLIQRHL